MARPREFDENEVLDKAMMCFWEKGYESASIKDLEAATGISRISLYNAFGDKEGLFVAVQNKYHVMAHGFIGAMLEEANSLETLMGFFHMLGQKKPDDSAQQYGCMMVNTVLSVDNIGDTILENVKKYREMMANLFREHLIKLKQHKKLHVKVDPEKASAFLLASMWGAMAMTRLYKDPIYSEPHTDIVVETIKGWSPS